MASRLARRCIATFAGLALVAVALVIALPFVASTQIVRDRIAQEFSHWSGYRVTLGGAPTITVWPSIRAELPSVVMSGWGAGDEPPVLISQTVEIDLSAFAALRGDIVPTRVHFQKPVLRVSGSENGVPVLKSPAGGKIRRAIEMTKVAIGEDPANPSTTDIPSGPFGTIEFSDAKIVTAGKDGVGETELATELNGLLQWPSLNGELSITASAIVGGEAVNIESRVIEPLLLFAGGTAEMSVALQSEPLQLSFSGVADVDQPLFIDGDMELATPSLRDMLEWSGYDDSPGMDLGALAVTGRLKGDVDAIKIEDAEIEIAQSPGMGVIEFALNKDNPSVSGTLDFESLDLAPFLSTFAILPTPPGVAAGTLERGLGGQFSLDLRVSVSNAVAGPAELTNVAAAIQIKDGLATFDISDATGFGGNISTGLRIDHESGKRTGEFRLLATDIDIGALAATAGFERMIPQARGKVSVILKGPVAAPRPFLRSASGSIAATFDTGTIADVDLNAFIERAKSGGFFSLDEVAGGTLAFERAELKATMSRGVANVEKAEARTADQLINLAGIVPYIGRSLALSGRISAAEDNEAYPDSLSFFVGGSWSSPFISAILPPPQSE